MFGESSIPIILPMKREHALNGNQVKTIFCVSLSNYIAHIEFTLKEMTITWTRVEGSENIKKWTNMKLFRVQSHRYWWLTE